MKNIVSNDAKLSLWLLLFSVVPGRKTFRRTVVAFPILLSSSGPNFGNTSDNFDKVILRHESADNPEKVRRVVIERYPAIIYFAQRSVGDLLDIVIPLKTA